MTKVLVLGSSGMLGSMVYGYLKRNPKLEVSGTTRDVFDAEAFAAGVPQKRELEAEWILNCIGVIKPFCKDNDAAGVRRAIAVNAVFPHKLAAEAKARAARVVQIATDCVYSGAKGQYVETDPHDALDVYGKTKSLGEVFDGSLLNVRCSIIGPELKNHVSLLDWFLGNKDGAELKGFTHHRWNGVTTLQYAKLCERIMQTPGLYERLLGISHVHHFLPNTAVDKYELLSQMNEVFGRKMKIQPVGDVGPAIDRTIASKHALLREVYPAGSRRDALVELAAEMGQRTAAR
jgi:dTDP-4-dehydrorhamnose reductase